MDVMYGSNLLIAIAQALSLVRMLTDGATRSLPLFLLLNKLKQVKHSTWIFDTEKGGKVSQRKKMR